MLKAVVTAALLFAALGARAEIPQMLGTDPLSRQILTKTAQENGGVTAAVRVGSGQVVELKLADMSASPFPAQMAPAAVSPAINLKPAEGLVPKPSKAKAKKAPRRAVDQLKRVFKAVKNWR
jgi:hypothetical protein